MAVGCELGGQARRRMELTCRRPSHVGGIACTASVDVGSGPRRLYDDVGELDRDNGGVAAPGPLSRLAARAK